MLKMKEHNKRKETFMQNRFRHRTRYCFTVIIIMVIGFLFSNCTEKENEPFSSSNEQDPGGYAKVTFGNETWYDEKPTLLFEKEGYNPRWFQLMLSPKNFNSWTDADLCIVPCYVDVYRGYATQPGNYNPTYYIESNHFTGVPYNDGWDFDFYFSLEYTYMKENGDFSHWHAKSFTVNVTQLDAITMKGSVTVDAVMYNSNQANLENGGSISTAETRTLKIEAKNISMVDHI